MRFITVLLCIGLCQIAKSQAWTVMAPIPVDLAFPVVSVLDSHIHVSGGGANSTGSDLHLRYSAKTNTWDTLAKVPFLAQQPGGGAIGGRVHHFGGGYPKSGQRITTHYSYDPGTDSWTQEAALPTATAIHKTAVIGDSIYMLSGQPDKQKVEVYNAITKKWSKKGNLPDIHFWYSAITTHQGKIFRFGGGAAGAPSDLAHEYDPVSDRWTSLPKLPMKLHAPDAAVLGDSIWIGGGYYAGDYHDTVFIYDVNAKKYSAGPSFSEKKSYHYMVNVRECIYVLAGHNNDGNDVGMVLTRRCQGDTITNPKPAPKDPKDTVGTNVQDVNSTSNYDWTVVQLGNGNLELVLKENDFKGHSGKLKIVSVNGQEVMNTSFEMPIDHHVIVPLSDWSIQPNLYIVIVEVGQRTYRTKLWLD